jgi:hypothetical protein
MNERERHGPPVSDLGPTLTQTIANSDLSSSLLELIELPLDHALDPGILREVPVLGTLLALWRTGRTVRDHLFTKKLLGFLEELSKVPRERRAEMIPRLHADSHFGRQVGEEVTLLLDRLDSIPKANLVGRAFRAYCQGFFDLPTLQRTNAAVDRILMLDLLQLPKFLDARGPLRRSPNMPS